MTTDIERFFDTLLARKSRQQPSGGLQPAGGQSVTFCLDISGSMTATDILPNRFRAAVNAIRVYTDARRAWGTPDMVAAVVFNEQSRIVSRLRPIEEVERGILRSLSRLDADGVTDIAAGLIAAERCLDESPGNLARTLVVLSDGHGGNPVDIADRIKGGGTIINCIGVGGSPSDVDEECLKQVCSTVNGRLRYRFITNARDLTEHFKALATGLARSI
jgi:Mg-chelatase subunit ChlD